ncbi:MAG: sirohydrochlorin cobaltochelatase [Deltaproteobacteria bacterium]|nr:sirohydrochlorin cobaltochelatase [Deltaproteobacteria bacterium]
MKQAILLAAYGAGGVQGAGALRWFESKVRDNFPSSSIRWAFTSMLMRRRLTASRKKNDSVKKALCRLGFEKYDRVTVQSLHLIPGSEYDGMLEEIEEARYCGAPPQISVGLPLLHDAGDIAQTALALLRHLPEERGPEEAVIWIGHGAQSEGGAAYALLTEAAQRLDPKVFVGTLSGEPGIGDILEALRQTRSSRAWLMPLLSVVGKHAAEDIAGEKKDSWRGILLKNGIACRSVLRGAIEYENLAAVWLRHLQTAVSLTTSLVRAHNTNAIHYPG